MPDNSRVEAIATQMRPINAEKFICRPVCVCVEFVPSAVIYHNACTFSFNGNARTSIGVCFKFISVFFSAAVRFVSHHTYCNFVYLFFAIIIANDGGNKIKYAIKTLMQPTIFDRTIFTKENNCSNNKCSLIYRWRRIVVNLKRSDAGTIE